MRKATLWEFCCVMIDMTVGTIIMLLFWAVVLSGGLIVGLGVKEALKLLGVL